MFVQNCNQDWHKIFSQKIYFQVVMSRKQKTSRLQLKILTALFFDHSERATELVHLNHFFCISFTESDAFLKFRFMWFKFNHDILLKYFEFE